MSTTFDDYGPPTDHPNDPRNGQTDDEEWSLATLEALESAERYIQKAKREIEARGETDMLIVTLAMDDAIVELGGIAPKRACAHKWRVTQQGHLYHDCRCDLCGETKRETWD